MKKGLFGSVFAKFGGKTEEDIVEKKETWTNKQEQVGRWNILMRYGKEKTPEATNAIFDEIAQRQDRCSVILMDYYQKEQIKASENMSWIYDVHYETLKQSQIAQILAIGKRCYDYKIRCLLAGIDEKYIDMVPTTDLASSAIRLSDVDTICFVVSPSNALIAEGIKDEMIKIMKKEEMK